MFIVPFGLRAKLYIKPWATVVIVVLCLSLSVKGLIEAKSSDQIKKSVNQEMTAVGTSIKAETLAPTNPSKDSDLLTKENINWLSLTLAQWMHKNWWTLLANILVFAAFAFYLEQRVGPFFLIAIYLSGGYLALFIQANLLGSNQWLGGSAANSMAVLGAYAFFFWKEKVRIHLNIFFAHKSEFLIPGWFYLGLFLILGNSFYFETELTENITLFSHLAGFSMGMLGAYLVSKISWVQHDFLFPTEQWAYLKAKKTAQPLKKIDHILELLSINPNNFLAVEYLFRSIAKYRVEPEQVPQKKLEKICQLIFRMINEEFQVEPTQAYSILSLIPISWDFWQLPVPQLQKKQLSKIENELLESDWRLAIRFYDLYLKQNKDSELRDNIITTVKKIIVNIESPLHAQSHQNIEWLRLYVVFNSQSVLGQLLADKYEDKTAAS